VYIDTKRKLGKVAPFWFLAFFTLLTSGAFYKCIWKISCAIFKKANLQWYKFSFYCSKLLFTIFQPLKSSIVKSLGFIIYLWVWRQIWLEEYTFLKQAINTTYTGKINKRWYRDSHVYIYICVCVCVCVY